MASIDFLVRYLELLVGTLVLLRLIFFRITPNRDAFFSFFLFANGVFLVTYLLHDVELSMGFAFGLFAIFAMLRYRTEPITIRDMTYLFVVIGMALMCSIANLSYPELGLLLLLICGLAAIGETSILAPRMIEKKIFYDNVENIKPDRYEALLEDLQRRTGLNILKVEVGRINYLSDSAELTVFCTDKAPGKARSDDDME